MKAIETIYNGYRFRSRLEARWAVFFDEMGISYEYEPEGFILSDGTKYLPDFKLTKKYSFGDFSLWCEIKPQNIIEDEKFLKFKSQIIASNSSEEIYTNNAILLSGEPLKTLSNMIAPCPRCGLLSEFDIYSEEMYFFCYPCDIDTPCGGDNPIEKGLVWHEQSNIKLRIRPHKGAVIFENKSEQNKYLQLISNAGTKARQSRFEFGENKHITVDFNNTEKSFLIL